jgi:hypothetical protein
MVDNAPPDIPTGEARDSVGYFVMLDKDSILQSAVSSNVDMVGFTEAPEEIFRTIQHKAHRVKYFPDTGEIVDLPPEEPVVRLGAISDRQFFQALAKPPYRLISQAEAMKAVKTGDIPAGLVKVIDQAESMGLFPEGAERFDIDILISGATSFEFRHPVSDMIALAFGWTESEKAEFWRFASTL